MSSRRLGSGLSALLSLGVILALGLALLNRPPEPAQITPTPLPTPEEAQLEPAETPPEQAAVRPVVLPPPPAPKVAPPAQVAQAVEPPPRAETPPPAKAPPKAVQPPPSAPKQVAAPAPPPPKQVAKPKPHKPEVLPAKKAPPPAPKQATPPPKPSVPRPVKHAAPQPSAAPRPKESPAPPPETTTASREDVAEGRTLLRLLEFGSGPSIELAWPDRAKQREALFRTLGQCFGMQVALMDRQGRLFVAQGGAKQPWRMNLDRYSGFIREPAGQLSRQERKAVDRIRSYHDGQVSGSPVRVFPRSVDARLLGGLQRLLGARYARTKTIRARYLLEGRRLVVEGIVADGRRVPGRLEVPAEAGGYCRGSLNT